MTNHQADAFSTAGGGLPAREQESLLPLLYAWNEEDDWGASMRAITHALLGKLTLPDGPVVEVGCGGGQMLGELAHRYAARPTIGLDLHPLALAQAQRVLPSPVMLGQSALPHLPLPDNALALLVALDVFDQNGVDLDAALAEGFRVLRTDGALVLRVSAHPRLFGPHDIAFHTGRRYTRRDLSAALAAAGFAIQRLTYANLLLSPPVAALRLVQRWGWMRWRADTYEQGLLHTIAARLLHREAAWVARGDLPWGISLCAVARKP